MSDEDPVRRHLDAAETWLANAEGYRAKIAELEPETAPGDGYEFRVSAARDQSGALLTSAIQIAELHRAMAQTINDLTPQRYVLDSTIDVERAVREQITAENADYVAAMEKRLGEQLKADDEAFQAVTLRPGADPEPEAEGELWTTGDGWFYYAVDTIPPMLPGMAEKPRWLLARHYAQVLRWSSEQGTKPMAYTWSEVAGHSSEGGSVFLRPTAEREVILRRPTAEERTAFYGPEPDPTPLTKECGHRGMCDCPCPCCEEGLSDPIRGAICAGCDHRVEEHHKIIPAHVVPPGSW